MSSDRTPRPWDIALVGASVPHAFVLSAVGSGLCRSKRDFDTHFVNSDSLQIVVQELTALGFFNSSGAVLELTAHGAALFRSLAHSVQSSNAASKTANSEASANREIARSDRIDAGPSDRSNHRTKSTDDGSLVGAGVGTGNRSIATGGVPSDPRMWYQTILYNRSLPPELFLIEQRRIVRHGDYELEVWLMPGQHVLRFERGGHCVCELLTSMARHLPSEGIVTASSCAGEVEFECDNRGLIYMTSVQTENLSEMLYATSLEELEQFARENSSLVHAWNDDAGRCLSLVDVQKYQTEVHVQSYHMIATTGLVIRTQTIFQHAGWHRSPPT